MHCILFGPFHSYITKKMVIILQKMSFGKCLYLLLSMWVYYDFLWFHQNVNLFYMLFTLVCIWIHGYFFLHSFQFIGIVCGKEYVRGLFKILLSISDVIEKRLFASNEKSSHMEWNDHSFQSIKNVMSELKAFLVYGVSKGREKDLCRTSFLVCIVLWNNSLFVRYLF